jgi:hypothetical protein
MYTVNNSLQKIVIKHEEEEEEVINNKQKNLPTVILVIRLTD